MVATTCTSHFTSIPLARSSFVTGSNLISSSASVQVIVAETFSAASLEATFCPNVRFVRNEHKQTRTKDLTALAIGPLHCGKPTHPNDDGLYPWLDPWLDLFKVQWFLHSNPI